MDINSSEIQTIVLSLQQYVVDNPDVSLQDCIGFIMSFGLNLDDAQIVIGLIGAEFASLYGYAPDFDQIKLDSISAASIEIPTIDMFGLE